MTGPQGTQESSLAPGFVDEDIKDEGLEEVFLPEFSCLVIESSPLLDSPLLPSSFPVFLCGNWEPRGNEFVDIFQKTLSRREVGVFSLIEIETHTGCSAGFPSRAGGARGLGFHSALLSLTLCFTVRRGASTLCL